MAASSAALHESADKLTPETIDRHRAIVSLMEELEAIDWYDQRVAASADAELRAVLAHNRDEEKEHAAMMLEWLRRHDAKLDEHLRSYLFKEGSVVAIEAGQAAGNAEGTGTGAAGDGSLGIGSLRAAGETP